MYVDEIARVAHEANRVVQALQNDPGIPVAPAWEEFPEDQRAGVRDGVENALGGTTPEESHRNWCDGKTADGWVWGPVKDTEQKTHPCLVPYAQLPAAQRVKDRLFLAIVEALGPETAAADVRYHQVVVSGEWTEEAPRRVSIDARPAKGVQNITVRDDVEHRGMQLVTLEFITPLAMVLPIGAEL